MCSACNTAHLCQFDPFDPFFIFTLVFFLPILNLNLIPFELHMESLIEDAEKSNRTTAITIRLEPKILESLDDIADRLGIKRATIVGYAIGEYVNRMNAQINAQETTQRLMVQELIKVFGPSMQALLESQEQE